MSFLELSGVSKGFRAGKKTVRVLHDVNLSLEEREFVCILGFSGSGKTTLISLIAGLLSPDSGRVLLRGKPIQGPGPERGVVFQNYSLLPWLSAYQNIALAVDRVFPDWTAKKRREHVLKHLDLVNLGHAPHKKPKELSGGMRQRVAVARALAMNPEVLLLDEPLSALDALTRSSLQSEIERIWAEQQKTVVMVTNDVDEGLLLADRIVPLTPGPNATFGPSFEVTIPRPRDKRALNHDATFKRLRNDILTYLSELREKAASAKAGPPRAESIPDGEAAPEAVVARRARVGSRRAHDEGSTGMSAYVELHEVKKEFPTPNGPAVIVEDFNLTMKKGEFVALIGHSGCGKLTVLGMLAGLSQSSGGTIIVAGREVTEPGPDRAVVFQSPCLLPWLATLENVSLGVDCVFAADEKKKRRAHAVRVLETVGLGDALSRMPGELSSGMQQRVGIARALALVPKMLLLDEPFGMLDSLTRMELQDVLLGVVEREQTTALMVTHDVDEALLVADRVVMMTTGPRARVGGIVRVDLPRPRKRVEVLEHPSYYELREELIGFLEAQEPEGAGRKAAA